MKFVVPFAVALALSIQPLSAAPTELTFTATVTFSPGTPVFPPPPSLPAVGAAVQGRVLFDYDPAAYVSEPCLGEPNCVDYSYASPYTFFVDLGTSQVSSPFWILSVVDDTTFFDPNGQPLDVVTLGTKVNGISYVLTLIGPPSSFTGTDIPPPSVLENFWTRGVFRVSSLNQTLLFADVSDVSVPEPSPYDQKLAVLADLQALLPALTKPNADKVKSAIEHLQKSLNPKFWADGDHLTMDGKPVFDEEKKSVHSLEEVVPRSLVIGAIESLVADDRALAMTAIAESTKSTNDIAKAQQEIAKGDTDAAIGKYEEAINHYKNAWDLAT
jgi:hypothetical protein